MVSILENERCYEMKLIYSLANGNSIFRYKSSGSALCATNFFLQLKHLKVLIMKGVATHRF